MKFGEGTAPPFWVNIGTDRFTADTPMRYGLLLIPQTMRKVFTSILHQSTHRLAEISA
jgi:hypothetical protein